uniref:Uncharacterized protein n=1 Tax=Amphiprion percula TaxID=161767 RepID=A0A3P8SY81_AMPPE
RTRQAVQTNSYGVIKILTRGNPACGPSLRHGLTLLHRLAALRGFTLIWEMARGIGITRYRTWLRKKKVKMQPSSENWNPQFNILSHGCSNCLISKVEALT